MSEAVLLAAFGLIMLDFFGQFITGERSESSGELEGERRDAS